MNSGYSSNAIGSAGAYVTISRTIAAGAVTIIDATGNYVACLASSLTSFLISLDAQGQSFMAKGLKVRAPLGQVFKSIVIDNSQNATALTFTLAIGVGDVSDARTTLAPAGRWRGRASAPESISPPSPLSLPRAASSTP